ncbi:neural-cadherin-like [Penaeus chinensis]|uniref:neural-cadherin-like n=1 Tax=Penaeus chinensis TaxID=139456 RepID=UPI001FB70B60|nr:neural-cadherin-like [Penaeus chinensis]
MDISSGSGVGVGDVGVGACVTTQSGMSWVVDANSTALVTPRLHAHSTGCACHAHHAMRAGQHAQHPGHAEQLPSVAAVTHTASCRPNPCRNGGRCIPHARGPRCVCPEGTSGSICKQLSRYFWGGGWAWTASIPTSISAHVSLEVKTRREDCLLLYAGPSNSAQPLQHLVQADVLVLELRGGRPRLTLDLGASPVLLEPSHAHSTPTLADGFWHRLDVVWGQHQRVEVVVDKCASREKCRLAAPLPSPPLPLDVAAPLQVGGLAHPPPDAHHHGWPTPLTTQAFQGCLRNLRVNGELRDLGHGVLSEGSAPGCVTDDSCRATACGPTARCVAREDGPQCECFPGWTGDHCRQRTQAASFAVHSYVKVALSSAPSPATTTLQLRFRTWEAFGQLLAVASQHGRDRLGVFLEGGHVCAKLMLHPAPEVQLCLAHAHLSDGVWHSVRVERYGQWVELVVDEGDGPLYNTTPTPDALGGWSAPLLLDRQEGVLVGGSPEYVGVSLFTVHHDFHEGCLDDLRVSGVSLPLPPLANSTTWAQATMFTHVHPSCHAPAACTNLTCPEPLTCLDVWRRHECGCGEGAALTREGGACRDVDECVWAPCLNGGTCVNRVPGYLCVCPKSYIGENCEGKALLAPSATLPMGVVVALVVWAVLVLVMLVVACAVYRRRRHKRVASGNNGVEMTSRDDLLDPAHDHSHDPALEEGHDQPADVLELHAVKPVSQKTWARNGMDHRPREPVSTVASAPRDDQGAAPAVGRKAKRRQDQLPHAPDDLRNYAYEGDGSSPGSLSSCCSGGDSSGDTGFLGGFQEVATLLNCLGSQSAVSDSPGRHHARPSAHASLSLATPSERKALPTAASMKRATPLSSGSLQHLRVASDKLGVESGREALPKEGPGIHDVVLGPPAYCHHGSEPHKSNSLPRPRAATLIINNVKDESLDCVTRRLAETYHHSLRRYKSVGCRTEASGSCCAPSLEGFEADPSVAPLQSQDVCRACITVSLRRQERAKPHSIPSRSLSASTVSFLAAAPATPALPSPPSTSLNNQFVQVLPRAQARHACTGPTCATSQECGCSRTRAPSSEVCDAPGPTGRPSATKTPAAGRT